MQLVTSKTISPRVYTSLLQSDFSDMFRRLERKHQAVSLHPFINFRGQISTGEFLFPVQKFSLREKDKFIFIENFPTDSFPKIKIILEEKNFIYEVKDFKVRPLGNSVQEEILYTRFFLMTAEAKKCSLNFSDVDFVPFNFSFSDLSLEDKKQMRFRAKLFRKLGFIENKFRTKFNVPENIPFQETIQIEVLFRGITEGKFSIPMGDSIQIFNYEITEEDLENSSVPKNKSFSFEFIEDLYALGKLFPVGKIKVEARKASIANPKILRNHKAGDVLSSLRLNVFDYQICHEFEKYSDSEQLLKNKRKLEQFKNTLRKEEPEYLVDLLDEPLAELDNKSALEIVEGLLQYHDFPDRYSVLTPELKENNWKVSIALTYPDREPIFLTDAFVDVRTGKVEMEISFDELLKKGRNKAAEALSLA